MKVTKHSIGCIVDAASNLLVYSSLGPHYHCIRAQPWGRNCLWPTMTSLLSITTSCATAASLSVATSLMTYHQQHRLWWHCHCVSVTDTVILMVTTATILLVFGNGMFELDTPLFVLVDLYSCRSHLTIFSNFLWTCGFNLIWNVIWMMTCAAKIMMTTKRVHIMAVLNPILWCVSDAHESHYAVQFSRLFRPIWGIHDWI